jgi:hypothetical protein
MGIMIGAPARPQSAAAKESENAAYCLSAIERFAAADRSLLARSGANPTVRDAAADSLQQYETSLSRLRALFNAVPDKDAAAMEAAERAAEADQAAFPKHYEVCWNYCSDDDVGSPTWQACIARCQRADPLISRLDRCRSVD